MTKARVNAHARARALGSVGLIAICACLIVLWQTPSAPTESKPQSRIAATEKHLRSASRIRWGIYQINWGAERFEKFLDLAIESFASSPDFVMFYRDLRCHYPARAIEIIRQRGAIPSISMELWHWGRGSTKHLPKINDGSLDDYFESWAKAAKADGQPVMLRFGFEFNGDWFSWSGDPAAYVEAWRRVHGIFKRVGADNVQWVWAPNVTSVPDVPENDMHLYYPGADYVDWVGVDGYNWGDDHDEWHTWQSCRAIFESVLAEFDRRYAMHAVMLAEFGSTVGDPGRKAEWIANAHEWLSTKTRVSAVIWFNLDKRREGEQDWRVNSTPQSLDAFNQSFAKPSDSPENPSTASTE